MSTNFKSHKIKAIKTKVLAAHFFLIPDVNYAKIDRYFNKIINAKEAEVAFKKVKARHALTNKDAIGIELNSETIFE